MKKIFLILLSFSVLIGCKNVNTSSKSNSNDTVMADTLTVDELLANPAGFVKKQVIISGMVSHVCKHGGQKLFLISSNPDKYLRINTSEGIAEFPVDLEGSNIEVKGVVTEFENAAPEEAGKDVLEDHEGDSSLLEKSYHKDNFYVIVAETYAIKD